MSANVGLKLMYTVVVPSGTALVCWDQAKLAMCQHKSLAFSQGNSHSLFLSER